MKHLIVIAAGLGYEDLDRRGLKKMAGLEFRPAESVFPAVTCVAQATFRTAAEPCDHGMVSNGFFSRKLMRPSFWEQSATLVTGPRIWDAARAGGAKASGVNCRGDMTGPGPLRDDFLTFRTSRGSCGIIIKDICDQGRPAAGG